MFFGYKKILKSLFSFIPWLSNFSDLPSYGSNSRKRYTLRLLAKCLRGGAPHKGKVPLPFPLRFQISKWYKIYTETDSGFKNDMRKKDNFRQAGKSLKRCISMGYIWMEYIPSTKTLYAEDLSNITFNYCENSPNSLCHFWNHKSFFTTQLLCIFLDETLHNFKKNIPSKCKFPDFRLLELKFMKFVMSFLEPIGSFSLNFASLFSVMRDISSVLFHVKL